MFVASFQSFLFVYSGNCEFIDNRGYDYGDYEKYEGSFYESDEDSVAESDEEDDAFEEVQCIVDETKKTLFDKESLSLYTTGSAGVLFFIKFLASVDSYLDRAIEYPFYTYVAAKMLCSYIGEDDKFAAIVDEIFDGFTYEDEFLKNLNIRLAMLRCSVFQDESSSLDAAACKKFCRLAMMAAFFCYSESIGRDSQSPIGRFLSLGAFFSNAHAVLQQENDSDEKIKISYQFFVDEFLAQKIKKTFAYNENIDGVRKVPNLQRNKLESVWESVYWVPLGEMIRDGSLPNDESIDVLLENLMGKIKKSRASCTLDQNEAILISCEVVLEWLVRNLVMGETFLVDFNPYRALLCW